MRVTPGDDRGSGTVLVVALVGVVLVLTAAIGLLARAQAARSAAQAAADLAALAAASSLAVPRGMALADVSEADAGRSGRGPADGPCALARAVMEKNRASMETCVVRRDGVVEVAASHATVVGPARAVARAGPASARDP